MFEALADNGYTGPLAMEFLPATDAAIGPAGEWVQARLCPEALEGAVALVGVERQHALPDR